MMVFVDKETLYVGDAFDTIRESRLIFDSEDSGFEVDSVFGVSINIDFEGELREVLVEVLVCVGKESGETWIEPRVTDVETGSTAYAERVCDVYEDSVVYTVKLSGEYEFKIRVVE